MRNALAATLAFAILVGGCSGGGATVSRTSFFSQGERVFLGGLIRTSAPLSEVELEIALKRDGRTVRTEPDTLPHCRPGEDCWWGTTIVHDGSIDAVEVQVVRWSESTTQNAPVRELRVERKSDLVEVRTPEEEGLVYVIAFERGRPRLATSFANRRDLYVDVRLRPPFFPVRKGQRVRAFFYPGPVPASVYGPSD